ncbi:hypothetical protein CWR48_08225 [Oceanobacillus arenosus]|uniref:QueT transporter family protein n=1 Tax=Oceanobacillus arenosus TaxID=1229153 RepID=A0A3D8PSC9_9BACI|nr:QueT transporter family protein [Oceanobacillus arenosus]RDW19026.1 hypothetical protein CWR48_08225 [Oceanobacillus arenosus]
MKVKTLVVNGLLAALYVAVSLLIQPFGFTNVQFRISEMFNHLVIFNKKFFFGIVLGVFITNLFSPLGWFDLVFGVAHSAISLGIIILLANYIKNKLVLLVINALIFSFNMFIIAFELKLALGLPFLFSWLTTAAGELVVLAVGVPLIYLLNKRVHFDNVL